MTDKKVPSCEGCEYFKSDGKTFTMLCDPIRGMPRESCLLKVIAVRLRSVMSAIGNIGGTPEDKKAVRELIRKTLEETKEGDEWKETP